MAKLLAFDRGLSLVLSTYPSLVYLSSMICAHGLFPVYPGHVTDLAYDPVRRISVRTNAIAFSPAIVIVQIVFLVSANDDFILAVFHVSDCVSLSFYGGDGACAFPVLPEQFSLPFQFDRRLLQKTLFQAMIG